MRGRDREDVLAKLKLNVENEIDEEVSDPGLYAVHVGKWLVVIGDGWDYMDLVTRRAAARLSKDGAVLYLYTDDTPMAAEISAFVDGKVKWSVTYDGRKGVSTPKTEGTLPAAAAKVLAKARKEQAAASDDVDVMYDVVAEMGREIVGFRHDVTLAEEEHLPVYQLASSQ